MYVCIYIYIHTHTHTYIITCVCVYERNKKKGVRCREEGRGEVRALPSFQKESSFEKARVRGPVSCKGHTSARTSPTPKRAHTPRCLR